MIFGLHLLSEFAIVFFLLSALLCVFLMGACFEYRAQKAVKIYLTILSLYIVWFIFNVAIAITPLLDFKADLIRWRFSVITFLSPLWFSFCIELFPILNRFKKSLWQYVAYVVPFTVAALSWFNLSPEHFVKDIWMSQMGSASLPEWTLGPVAQTHLVYSYLLLVVNVLVCVWGVRRQTEDKKFYGVILSLSLILYAIPEQLGFFIFPELRSLGLPVISQCLAAVGFFYILQQQQAVLRFSQVNDRLLDLIPIPVVLLDSEFKLRSYNSQAEQLFGIDLASVGTPFNQLDREQIASLSGSQLSVDKQIEIVSGSRHFHFEMAVKAVEHRVLKGAGYLISLVDITQLKNTTQLNQRILTLISHDLMGNLNGIASLARKKDPQYLGILADAANGAVDLIRNILMWSATSGGFYSHDPMEVSLDEIMEQVKQQTYPTLYRKEIELCGNAFDCGKVLNLDLKMFSGAMRNLITNASSFSPDRGKVAIVFEEQEDSVVIHVDDQGPGMSEEIKTRVMATYSDRPISSGSGYGIGLYIVKQFLNYHQGFLEINRSPWMGCRVSLVLPKSALVKD